MALDGRVPAAAVYEKDPAGAGPPNARETPMKKKYISKYTARQQIRWVWQRAGKYKYGAFGVAVLRMWSALNGVLFSLVFKVLVLAVVYGFTILMPTLTIFLFRKINGFTPDDLRVRRHRYMPFLLTIISYVFCLLTMRQLNLPWYMNGIILAALLTLIICVAFNLRWKLSEHMAGAGGIVGGLVAFSELFGYNPVGWLCIFILVAGMLGSARIILRHHTQGEVLGGFAVGLLCSLAALHPGSKLLIYLFSYILF